MQIDKAVLERMSSKCEVVILRPTAIFGPGGKNLLKLAEDLQTGVENYLIKNLRLAGYPLPVIPMPYFLLKMNCVG